MAARIAGKPALAVQLAMDVIRAARGQDDSAFDTEQLATAVLFSNSTTQEKIRAVLERGVGKD